MEAEQPAAVDVPVEAEEPFELQSPPAGKRPRTPNELDQQAEQADAEGEVGAVPQTPKSPAKTPLENGVEAGEEAPRTPRSVGLRRSSQLSAGKGETAFVPNGTIPGGETTSENHVGMRQNFFQSLQKLSEKI